MYGWFALVLFGNTMLFDVHSPLTMSECKDIVNSWVQRHNEYNDKTAVHGQAFCMAHMAHPELASETSEWVIGYQGTW